MRYRLMIGGMLAALFLLLMNLGAGAVETASMRENETNVDKNQETRDADKNQAETTVPYEGKIALTFDDGPTPGFTEAILDILLERDVRATFFVLGKHVEANPEIVRRIQTEGHLIGNHTYSHMELTDGNCDLFMDEVEQTNVVLEDVIGYRTAFVRPPFGCCTKRLQKEASMITVLWTIDSKDWCSTDADAVTNRVVTKAEDGAIILMHDGYDCTVEAVVRIVDTLLAKGYDFVTVDEILMN